MRQIRSAIAPSRAARRPWTFYVLATVFALYVLALYGPMICIYILSFQDIRGGLVFPMKGHLAALVRRPVHPGAHRRRQGLVRPLDQARGHRHGHHRGGLVPGRAGLSPALSAATTFVFYLMIGSLVAPGLVLGLGIGLLFQCVGIEGELVHLGARRAAVLDAAVRRAGDVRGDVALRPRLGGGRATISAPRRWQTIRLVVIPMLAPGLVAVALFGFTLSYDEFARTLQTAGSLNTLPLEIWSMTLNVTSPSLYALGTVTTIVSFVIIAVCLGAIVLIQKRRGSRAPAATEEDRHAHRVAATSNWPASARALTASTNAVDGVNLKIPDGAYCCFLGPSGCGKTTILRMIAGHEDPTAGEILIGGENVVGLPPVAAPHGDDVPVLRAVPASDRPRQHRLCAARARPCPRPSATRPPTP